MRTRRPVRGLIWTSIKLPGDAHSDPCLTTTRITVPSEDHRGSSNASSTRLVTRIRPVWSVAMSRSDRAEPPGRGRPEEGRVDCPGHPLPEPEETPELEQTLFGVADPIGPVVSEDEIDEEAVEEELEEDLLTVADEEELELPELPADEELPAAEDEAAAEDESAAEEP